MAERDENERPAPSVPRLQIVAEDQQFTKELPGYMKDVWKLWDAGFDYNLVAVFGSQSTGKSTLLNKLFSTTFDVMSESARRQTTKGIWMSEARTHDQDGGEPVPNSVLVMDVEGTDGRERGEDQDFERKSALFSVAVAQVIIVNMWEHMVGLYNGANMGLLKTVFEVNLQLFHGNQDKENDIVERRTKTLLLFVIRDHIGHTPLENLSKTLMTDLEVIWAALAKPKGLETSVVTDFFDMMFTSLPHKILMPDKFDKAANELRRRFTDKSDKDYVFRPIYHKRIPADGFPHYAESIWAKIVSNKDLDLPSQQELLAQYRCDEIASVALGLFTDAVMPYRSPIEGGRIVDGLGPAIARARDELMATFDRDASRYHALVYKRKRTELMRAANTTLATFYLGQLKNLGKKALSDFSKDLDERLNDTIGSLGALNGSFLEHVKCARELAGKYFISQAEAICLRDTEWSYAEQLSQLWEEIDEVATRRRGEEVSKMVASLERNFVRDISEPLSKHLNEPSSTMWARVIEDYKAAYDRAKEKLIRRAKSEFDASNDEIVSAISALRRNAWGVLTKKVSNETSDSMMMVKLRDRFEDRFRYDEDGLPRVWKPGDDIDGAYRRAKEDALSLVPLFAKIDADLSELELDSSQEGFDREEATILLPESKQHDLAVRFRRDADASYVDAKRSVVSTTGKVPSWILGMMLVLGWNEIWLVVTNPLYLFVAVVFASGAYVVYALDLQGPVQRVARVVLAEGTKLVEEKVRDARKGHVAAGTAAQGRRRLPGERRSSTKEEVAEDDSDWDNRDAGQEDASGDFVSVLKTPKRTAGDATERKRRTFMAQESSIKLERFG